jgi:hypothetical protein
MLTTTVFPPPVRGSSGHDGNLREALEFQDDGAEE